MKCNKPLVTLIVFSLTLPSHLLGQVAPGMSILEFVQTHPKPQDLFSMRGRLFNASRAGIGNLNDIEQINGIKKVWSITATGNNIEVVKANTFNYPQFKNLSSLDLSNNKITDVEPGALNGLESLRFLWLNGNKLTSLQDGALRGSKVKFVFIANNPGGKELQKQIQQQLPHANVYTVNITQATLKKAAIGIPVAIVAVVLGAFTYQKITQREEELASAKGSLEPLRETFEEGGAAIEEEELSPEETVKQLEELKDPKKWKEKEKQLEDLEQNILAMSAGSDKWMISVISLLNSWQSLNRVYNVLEDTKNAQRAQLKGESIQNTFSGLLLNLAQREETTANDLQLRQEWAEAATHWKQAQKFYEKLYQLTNHRFYKNDATLAQNKAESARAMAATASQQ